MVEVGPTEALQLLREFYDDVNKAIQRLDDALLTDLKCHCGYLASSSQDKEDHITASMNHEGNHG